ncbi:hypothetical protein C8R32_1263 [Nitrosospira sp. Nsp5]|uniref:Uncharacterized protein n=1 Tax=Nitrosospira multiformis TaxID=1231 RepID=A0ABY0TCY7_9PROT|nr:MULTISPECIES: hypothetical protein [Nitrosospira]PTR05198.1 hypothetical protein C8R32_1263 [Nitrosospira sp. Nsp5]SDQ64170.1 hypothetical protein SAMN05216402_1663 [Nitrosospira multiformis]
MTPRARRQATSAEASPEYRSNPELALAALICLMSRFPARRSPAVAAAIIVHLRLISEDVRLSHGVRHCADSLIDEWAAYAMLCTPGATDAQQRLPS